MRRIRLWVDPKYLRRESNHPQITQITRPHSKPKGYDPPTHTKHRELHFVLVWFRVDSCDFVDRPPVKTLPRPRVTGLLHR